MKSYTCPSCGAVLVCDDNFAASSCPYCGNPTIVPGQFADMLKPDLVIPFKLEKQDALIALKKHYGKKFLLPQAFKYADHLDEVRVYMYLSGSMTERLSATAHTRPLSPRPSVQTEKRSPSKSITMQKDAAHLLSKRSLQMHPQRWMTTLWNP